MAGTTSATRTTPGTDGQPKSVSELNDRSPGDAKAPTESDNSPRNAESFQCPLQEFPSLGRLQKTLGQCGAETRWLRARFLTGAQELRLEWSRTQENRSLLGSRVEQVMVLWGDHVEGSVCYALKTQLSTFRALQKS